MSLCSIGKVHVDSHRTFPLTAKRKNKNALVISNYSTHPLLLTE